MKTRMKALSALTLALLFVVALTGCGKEEPEVHDSGLSITVEAAGVYEILAETQFNSETGMNADQSEMSGDYYFETTTPCNLFAYDKDGAILAMIGLGDEYDDGLLQLTLTESMEFVEREG